VKAVGPFRASGLHRARLQVHEKEGEVTLRVRKVTAVRGPANPAPRDVLTFSILGVPIARDAALVEAGGDLKLGPQTKVGVAYVGQLANNARDHSVKGNFSWRF
jgi:hypothetical protein